MIVMIPNFANFPKLLEIIIAFMPINADNRRSMAIVVQQEIVV